MIVVGLDLETTGTDKVKDRSIEVGLTLWSTNYERGLESHNFFVQSDGVKVPPDATEVNGIHQSMVDTFGLSIEEAFEEILYFVDKAQAIVTFNGRRFDIPMLHLWAKRLSKTFPEKPVIDVFEDMPKTSDAVSPGMRPQELITMCAKEEIYFDPHEAGADVIATLKLMSKRPFDFVWQRAESPTVVVRSMQHQSENKKAKKHKFRWNPDHRIWWKAVKEIDLDHLVKQVNNEFGLEVLSHLTPEDLDTDD